MVDLGDLVPAGVGDDRGRDVGRGSALDPPYRMVGGELEPGFLTVLKAEGIRVWCPDCATERRYAWDENAQAWLCTEWLDYMHRGPFGSCMGVLKYEDLLRNPDGAEPKGSRYWTSADGVEFSDLCARLTRGA